MLIVVPLLAVAVLGLVVAGAIAAGRAALVVTHGISMNPVYYQGDLVVVTPAADYHIGQIVAYRIPAEHLLVLHRIVGGNADGFVMKGDNNQSIDATHPRAAQIVGRATLHLPQGGLWLERLGSPTAVVLAVFALTVGGSTTVQSKRRRKRAAMSRHANRHPTGRTQPLTALPPILRTAAAAAATLAVLGLSLGALAWHAAPDRLARTFPATGRQLTFSYSAAVRPSPAYEGNTARSPDPVFRRLANTVEIHLAYAGDPGDLSVAANLSTPSGWHTSIPLAPTAEFLGNRKESAVGLDLHILDARAQAAAAATGLPSGPLTVAVTATIRTPGQTLFAPTLKFSLTPLQLSLVDGAASLTVHDTTAIARTTRVQNTLTLLSRQLPVNQARALSAALLLASLITAVLLAWIARRSAPVSEGAAIRSRYGALLAATHPVTAPPNRPIVEVTEFNSLAALAQRTGLLVLHWSRSDVDTFVVLDEGTTYRYRTGSATDTDTDTSSTGAERHDRANSEISRTA
jgi:signal peptidase I